MSVSSILNLLHELNQIILCEPLVMNLHELSNTQNKDRLK
jgi:hypothetical protein